MKINYKNRYGSVITFELQEDGNILWTGNFEYCRIGMPNDYTKAYNSYLEDNKNSQSLMTKKQFEKAVHNYNDVDKEYTYYKYLRLVEPLVDEIDMVDPSGGPYINVGIDLGVFNKNFKGKIVKEIKKHKDGWLLIIKQRKNGKRN